MKRFIPFFAVVAMLCALPVTTNASSSVRSDASISLQVQGNTVTAVKFTSKGTVIKNNNAVKEVTDAGVYLTVSGITGKATSSDRNGYAYMVTLKNGTWYFN